MGLKIAKVTDTRSSAEYKLRAHRAYNSGDLNLAAEQFMSSLDVNEQDGEAYLQLATIFAELGSHDKGIVCAKRAIELDPYNGDAYNVLGVNLFSVGWYRTGELCFKKALEFKPDHQSAVPNRVECLRRIREGGAPEEPPELAALQVLFEVRLPTVSLCMIVKNEEHFLEECLQSVQGAVDEICIVDTGSSDRTVEIAKKFGARLGYHQWNGDFATARNKSIDMASSDWILVLDADERITPETIQEVRRCARDKTKIGNACIIENLVGEKEGDGKQLAMIFRFFQNRPDCRYEGLIHEQILPAAQRTGLPQGASRIRIIHKGYLKGCVENRNKHDRNLNILLEQVKKEPENPYCHFNLGQTFKMMSRNAESEHHYKIGLEMLRRTENCNSVPYFAGLLFSYTEVLREEGRYDEALDLANEAMQRFPQFADIQFTKGNIYLAQERFEEAIKVYEGCRKLAGQVFAGGTDPGTSTYKVTNGIGVCYAKLGKLALAKQYLKRALKEWPSPNSEIHTNLGIILFQEENNLKALEHFTTALEIDPKNFQAWLNLGSVCQKQGNLSEAIAAWLQSAAIKPTTPDLHYLIGEANMRLGSLAAGRQALEIELENNPGHASSILALGLCEVLEGQYPRAITRWATFLADNPEATRGAEFRSAIAYAKLTGGAAADTQVIEEIGLAADLIAMQWQGIFDLSLQSGRFADCEKIVAACTDLSDALPRLDEALGQVLLKWKVYDLALDRFLRQQARTPDQADIYYAMGEACLGLGNELDADVMFETCTQINPHHVQARSRLRQLRIKTA